MQGGVLRAGRFEIRRATMLDLIKTAYGIDPDVVFGGPDWLEWDRFDVIAKSPANTPPATVKLMLQALLADRFALRLHREIRERSVDALVVGKSPKLQTSEATDPDPRGFVLHSGKLPGYVAVEGHAISLPGLVNYLSNHHRDRLIVDATGLKGVYDFSVEYEIDTEKVADRSVPVADAAASLMDDLVKAVGLKIESGRRLPVEMLVIDQISSPEPN